MWWTLQFLISDYNELILWRWRWRSKLKLVIGKYSIQDRTCCSCSMENNFVSRDPGMAGCSCHNIHLLLWTEERDWLFVKTTIPFVKLYHYFFRMLCSKNQIHEGLWLSVQAAACVYVYSGHLASPLYLPAHQSEAHFSVVIITFPTTRWSHSGSHKISNLRTGAENLQGESSCRQWLLADSRVLDN